MYKLPAICQNCNMIFPSSFAAANGAKMFMMGCKSGPCPNCGGTGDIADGLYEEIEGIFQITKIDDGKDLDKLIRILKKNNYSNKIDSIESEILAEVPQYSPLINNLIKNSDSSTNFAAYIQTFIAIITLLYTVYSSERTFQQDESIREEFYHELYKQELEKKKKEQENTLMQEEIKNLQKEIDVLQNKSKKDRVIKYDDSIDDADNRPSDLH